MGMPAHEDVRHVILDEPTLEWWWWTYWKLGSLVWQLPLQRRRQRRKSPRHCDNRIFQSSTKWSSNKRTWWLPRPNAPTLDGKIVSMSAAAKLGNGWLILLAWLAKVANWNVTRPNLHVVIAWRHLGNVLMANSTFSGVSRSTQRQDANARTGGAMSSKTRALPLRRAIRGLKFPQKVRRKFHEVLINSSSLT